MSRVRTDAVDDQGDTVELVFPQVDITRATQQALLDEYHRLRATIRSLEGKRASEDSIRTYRWEAEAIKRIHDENQSLVSEHTLTQRPLVDQDPGDESSS